MVDLVTLVVTGSNNKYSLMQPKMLLEQQVLEI